MHNVRIKSTTQSLQSHTTTCAVASRVPAISRLCTPINNRPKPCTTGVSSIRSGEGTLVLKRCLRQNTDVWCMRDPRMVRRVQEGAYVVRCCCCRRGSIYVCVSANAVVKAQYHIAMRLHSGPAGVVISAINKPPATCNWPRSSAGGRRGRRGRCSGARLHKRTIA